MNRLMNSPEAQNLFEYGTLLKISPNIQHADYFTDLADEIFDLLFRFLFKKFGSAKNTVIIDYVDHRTQNSIRITSSTYFKGAEP